MSIEAQDLKLQVLLIVDIILNFLGFASSKIKFIPLFNLALRADQLQIIEMYVIYIKILGIV